MKKLIISTLLCVLSVSAFAQLTDSEQRLVEMMKSGDLRELKAVSQQIVQTNIKKTEILDISAEILLRKYPYAYSHEIDTLAWLARGLGASGNDRYYNVLNEVVTKAGNRKLASHAQKAQEFLSGPSESSYKLGDADFPEGIYPVKTQADQDKELMAMITSGNLSELKNAAKQMISSNNESQALHDAAAEVLFSLYLSALDYQVDTLAWVAKALGQNKSGRYHELLKEVVNSGHKKLKKHAKKALKAHGKAKGEQYQKGDAKITTTNYI